MQSDSTTLNLLLENTAFENAYIQSGGILNDVVYNASTNEYDPNWDFEGIDSETHQLRADDVSNCWQGWQLAKQNPFLFNACTQEKQEEQCNTEKPACGICGMRWSMDDCPICNSTDKD